VRRYLRLLGLQFRTSVVLAAQYRSDFLLDAVIGLFWTLAAVMPLFVVYGEAKRPAIPGWSFGETLLVVGFFITLQAVLDGAINPGLAAVVDHVRSGTLDFVLLKPADAQFLVSTSRFQLWRVSGFLHAAIVFAIAFSKLGHGPDPLGIVLALGLMAVSTLLLYSIWILIVSLAFVVVKVDNLTYLFTSIFDAARWPSAVFRGPMRFIFTFIIPLAVMTTFPAEALLGRLAPSTLLYSVVGALAFAGVARAVWSSSIRNYTSAGG
jgi:ABC-2 type transport system permease protein